MRSWIRSSGWKIGVVLMAGLWLVLMAGTWSEAAESKDSAKDDEYSFNWLDPDKKIYVLQNRKYLKSDRPMLSVMAGTGFSNSYRTVYTLDPRLTYYFSESFGFEAFYTFASNSENNTYKALQQAAPNTLPVVREIRSQYGLLAQWVPWYAKINVFNKILYFDWYFSGGVGSVNTVLETKARVTDPSQQVKENRFAFYLATGQLYHLSQHFLVRLDLTGAFYQGRLFGTSGDMTWYSNYGFGIGIGYRF